MSVPVELSSEREVLLADMVDTMVHSLHKGCSPPEAALVVAHVLARVVFMSGGDATKDDAMFEAVVKIARDTLARVRAAGRSS